MAEKRFHGGVELRIGGVLFKPPPAAPMFPVVVESSKRHRMRATIKVTVISGTGSIEALIASLQRAERRQRSRRQQRRKFMRALFRLKHTRSRQVLYRRFP